MSSVSVQFMESSDILMRMTQNTALSFAILFSDSGFEMITEVHGYHHCEHDQYNA